MVHSRQKKKIKWFLDSEFWLLVTLRNASNKYVLTVFYHVGCVLNRMPTEMLKSKS